VVSHTQLQLALEVAVARLQVLSKVQTVAIHLLLFLVLLLLAAVLVVVAQLEVLQIQEVAEVAVTE
jgi:hypothetical protein